MRLCYGLSFSQRLIRPQICRQVVNQSAKLASEIFIIECVHNWGQLLHVKTHHVMFAMVLLVEMHGQVRSGQPPTAENAAAAQSAQDFKVLPEICKLPLCKQHFQSVLV